MRPCSPPASHPFHAPTRRARSVLFSLGRAHIRFSPPPPEIPVHPTMKPPMQEELEDDLAAEEENKLINEVLRPSIHIW